MEGMQMMYHLCRGWESPGWTEKAPRTTCLLRLHHSITLIPYLSLCANAELPLGVQKTPATLPSNVEGEERGPSLEGQRCAWAGQPPLVLLHEAFGLGPRAISCRL